MTTIIAEKVYQEQEKNDRISVFLKKFKIGAALSSSNFYKEKGAQPIELFRYLFELVFINKNIYRETTMNPRKGISKNTVYRFLKSSAYDWCKLLFQVAMNVIATVMPLTDEGRENVLIVDDTLYSRSRSKKVDMLTKVFDHNTHKYIKGFKLLTLAWSDGNTTIPLRFNHLVSKNEKMIINSLPDDMDKRTRAYKLRESARQNPVEAMLKQLDSVNIKALKAKYLLFDSWFSFPSVIMKACKRNINVICMLKNMKQSYYSYRGKAYNLTSLYERIPHNKKGEIIGAVTVKIHNTEKDEQNVRVVFLRTNKGNNWIALLSTDTKLSNEEIVRIYGKRWNIEVFFKTSKHYLHLDTELECRSFESIYAQTAIVFIRYIMLAYESRVSQDDRACGALFYLISDELKDISYLEALMILLSCFIDEVKNQLVVTETLINSLIAIFIAQIPRCFSFS